MKNLSAPSAAPDRTSRDHSFDNIRFVLILLVVFAHLLEIAAPFRGNKLIYEIIYSFHMPAFIFMFGYFSRFSLKRIAQRWIIPYFIFQTLYLLFARYVLRSGGGLQYATPYWLLWYLPACIYYQLMIPLYSLPKQRDRIAVFLGSDAIALLAGRFDFIGYPLSLSRFLVFQPWFIVGLYWRRSAVRDRPVSRKQRVVMNAIIICSVLASLIFMYFNRLPHKLLYGSVSYHSAKSSVWMRSALMLISLSWLLFIFITLKPLLNRRIPLVTAIGQNTLPVFLLHGFIVKSIEAFCPFILSAPWQIVLVACAIVLITASRPCRFITDLLCLNRPAFRRNSPQNSL